MSSGSSPMSSPALVGDADANNRPVEELQNDFRVHAQIFRYMLSSLQDHFGETSKHRTPRLCLTYCRQHEFNWSEFNLLFCDCNYRQDSENGYQWQWRWVDIYIELHSTHAQKLPRASRFLELEPSITDANGAESFSRLPNQEDKKLSRQFVFRALRTRLADLGGTLTPPGVHIGTRTLGHFLALVSEDSSNDLDGMKFRLELSCALTKGLSLFYKTSMMPRSWTEDTIEFMFRKYGDGSTSIRHHLPMISAPADPDPPEDDISVLTSRFAAQSLEDPKFPEIKALGVMLLQIWLKMPMAQLSRQYPGYFENGTVTRVGETALCHSLHTGILRHLPEELRPVCEVVERCFNDELFEQHPDDSEPTVYIRRQIAERLFEPLEQLKRAQFPNDFHVLNNWNG